MSWFTWGRKVVLFNSNSSLIAENKDEANYWTCIHEAATNVSNIIGYSACEIVSDRKRVAHEEMHYHSEEAARLDKQAVVVGVLFRPASLWVGAHWSEHNKRLCINPFPGVTLWIKFNGGVEP